jgi:hypothetical protein
MGDMANVTQRLYFADVEDAMVCVGMDGYAGPYYASDHLRVPDDLDPVGLTLAVIEGAARARSAADFAARRRAPRGGDGS